MNRIVNRIYAHYAGYYQTHDAAALTHTSVSLVVSQNSVTTKAKHESKVKALFFDANHVTLPFLLLAVCTPVRTLILRMPLTCQKLPCRWFLVFFVSFDCLF